ncbi:MAG TPA: gamma-glutamyltransferase [Fimbriiglobus sp.]|jgi:gamma-glutamyltranspeptidase/glutathione hydrolase
MKRWILSVAVIFATGFSSFAQDTPRGQRQGRGRANAGPWQGAGKNGAVAAGGLAATEAGMEILKAGGNAMDAAAATIFALSITDGTLFCFGGEVPILVYDAKRGVVEVVCGMGTAPRLATLAHFAKTGIPGKGIEPAAVPGAVDACLTVLDRYGTKSFAEVIAPTLRLLDKHVQPWHAQLAVTIRKMIDAEKGSPANRRRGLRLVADYFYRGPVAREIDAWSKANGGLIRYSDLATYATHIEEPVTTKYRGYTVCKCGVWTQGPYLLETLNILAGYDLKAMGHNTPEAIHTEAEALKLGLADRDVYFADPNFASVPLKEIIDPKYGEKRRALIDPQHASLVQRPGDPAKGLALLDNYRPHTGPGGPNNDTTTCVTADKEGNVVAATPSGFTGALAGKTGVWLGSRLQSFNVWPDSPNVIEPGKRPRITLTPSLVLKDGKAVIATSVAGGDMQDQSHLQLLTNMIDFGMAPAEAVTAPQFGTNHFLGSFRQTAPELGNLHLNPRIPAATADALKALGHHVVMKRPGQNPVAIRIDAQTGVISAAGDPGSRRHALAY